MNSTAIKMDTIVRKGLCGHIDAINSPDIDTRIAAARSLSHFSESIPVLLNALAREADYRVAGAILVSLQMLGGKRVVEGLLPYLHLAEHSVSMGVIEVLRRLPDDVENTFSRLLFQGDKETQSMAISLIVKIPHDQKLDWLHRLAKATPHRGIANQILVLMDKFPDEPRADELTDLINARFEKSQKKTSAE